MVIVKRVLKLLWKLMLKPIFIVCMLPVIIPLIAISAIMEGIEDAWDNTK